MMKMIFKCVKYVKIIQLKFSVKDVCIQNIAIKKCQDNDWEYHKTICYSLDFDLYKNKDNIILHQSLRMNLFQEYQALKTQLNEYPKFVTPFDKGRFYLYKGIIGMVLFNPVNANIKIKMTSEEQKEWKQYQSDIHKGGKLISSESEEFMYNELIFAFIPKSLHREIDYIWNGSWRC